MWRHIICACVVAFMLMVTTTQATEKNEEMTGKEIKSEDVVSNQNSSEKGPLGRALDKKRQENEGQANKKERYIFLLEDSGFAYYLDSQNARWITIPYSKSEDILDVWIRLTKLDGDGEYSYPPKYYLEHYYLRPKTKQIQFLSELEVTGRPDNTVKERPYSVHNWENLVPGSLEDEIYHGVMKYMQRNDLDNIWPRGKSFRDVLEDTLRISL